MIINDHWIRCQPLSHAKKRKTPIDKGNNDIKNTNDDGKTIINNTQGNSKPTNKTDHKIQRNLGARLNLRETRDNNNKLTIDANRATPPEVNEINTKNIMVTLLLKKALSSPVPSVTD